MHPSYRWMAEPGPVNASQAHQSHSSQARTQPLQVLWTQPLYWGSHICCPSRALPMANKASRPVEQSGLSTVHTSGPECMCALCCLHGSQLVMLFSSSVVKITRLAGTAQLVAQIGSLGHFSAIVANFMSSGHALSKFTFQLLAQALPRLSPKDSLLPKQMPPASFPPYFLISS